MSDSNTKRTDYLDWDEYFMATAHLAAMRSKDPNTQVGTCIVNNDKRIVGIGYNGMPSGCSDDLLPWGKFSDSPLETKYLYVCHAEMNAIANKNSADVRNCSLYTTLFPCNECAKLIIQSGIREVVYQSLKNEEKPANVASKIMLDMAGVSIRQFSPKREKIIISLKETTIETNHKVDS